MAEYPDNWRDIAKKVKQEAGYRCVRCHHPHETPSRRQPCDMRCKHDRNDGKQRVLTVHHIDGNKANCRWWNLAALCQVCHLTIQAKVDIRQPYMFDHSEWFRPYVAGYYAYRYLGEDLSREQVTERVDDLLALVK